MACFFLKITKFLIVLVERSGCIFEKRSEKMNKMDTENFTWFTLNFGLCPRTKTQNNSSTITNSRYKENSSSQGVFQPKNNNLTIFHSNPFGNIFLATRFPFVNTKEIFYVNIFLNFVI